MSFKSIELTNIQSHRYTKYKFPETGIINICGENSDGKSVLTKAVFNTLIEPSLHIKSQRISLLSRWATFGEIRFEFYDRSGLTVHIEREVSRTYYILDSSNVKVFVNGQMDYIKSILQEFGLNSINVYRTLTPVPFVTTSAADNYKYIAACTRDFAVENAIDNMKQCKDQIKKTKEQFMDLQEKSQIKYDSLVSYDMEKERAFSRKGCMLAVLLKCLHDTPIDLQKLDLPIFNKPEVYDISLPDVNPIGIPVPVQIKDVMDLNTPEVNKVPLYSAPPTVDQPLQLGAVDYLDGVSVICEDNISISKLKASTCPTCGRLLIDD
jgi:hypothetical protein